METIKFKVTVVVLFEMKMSENLMAEGPEAVRYVRNEQDLPLTPQWC